MLDLKKPIKTRDGRSARIICTDARCSYQGIPQPLIALIGDIEGDGECFSPRSYTVDGAFIPGEPSDEDLVNVAVKKTVKVEVRLYSGRLGQVRSNSSPYRPDDPGYDELFDPDHLSRAIIDMEYDE